MFVTFNEHNLDIRLNFSNAVIGVVLVGSFFQIAYRFVTVPVGTNGTLCVICGTEPCLKMIQDIAQNTFRSDLGPLLNIESVFKKYLADYLEYNVTIETVIFANVITRKAVSFTNQQQQAIAKRFSNEIDAFYLSRQLFDQVQNHPRLMQEMQNITASSSKSKSMWTVCEQYWSSDNYKYYVLTDVQQNILCLLCTAQVPTHFIRYVLIITGHDIYIHTEKCNIVIYFCFRNIANKVFTQICHEKSFCW